MSNPIVFTVTNAGLAAALSAQQNGLLLKLNKFVVGSGKQVVNADTAALVNQWGEFPIAAGDIETASKTLRFSAVVSSNTKKDVFEVGLYTDTNVLFAVAGKTDNDPYFAVWPNIDFVGSYGLSLAQVDIGNINLVVDQNAALALSIFNQHVATADPHPQYTKKTELQAHLDAADPHNQYPLKTALANAIWHVDSWHGTNSTSYNPATALAPFFGYETTWYLWPYVPAGVANTSAALGQISGLGEGSLLAATTRIWQRLPDGASPPSYSLTASQTTVDEGQQVTFTLNTTGVAQGTAVAWLILPIPLNGVNSSDISPSNMSGSFIVGADGSATYQILLISDNTTEGTEVLQFMLPAFPNQLISVTINDTSANEERIVNISSGSNTGINLLDAFVAIHGQPTSATKAIFIIENGVEIIAPDTATPAIYGDTWPNGSIREVQISSGAKVIGRGGNGGTAIDVLSSVASKSGGNGGTAISAANGSAIIVNNQGLIAGGGGGGGASGAPLMIDGAQATALVIAGTGGAPFGVSGALSAKHPSINTFMIGYRDANTTEYRWGHSDRWARIIGNNTTENTTYFTEPPKLWLDATLNSTVTQSSAYVSIQGFGTSNVFINGGTGGQIGENGEIGRSFTGIDNVNGGTWETLVGAGNGGLAGYIYQGAVTINNLSGGQTKGRTP